MDSRETTFEHQRVAAARFNNIFLKLFDRHQWWIQDFFLGGGALVSCSTSTPVNQIVFFFQNTSCIRKLQVISGGGGVGAAAKTEGGQVFLENLR